MEKGRKNRKWTPEQKLEIVHKHLNDHISVKKLEKEYQVEHSTICHWTKNILLEEKQPLNRSLVLATSFLHYIGARI